jgi:hypothetical protein
MVAWPKTLLPLKQAIPQLLNLNQGADHITAAIQLKPSLTPYVLVDDFDLTTRHISIVPGYPNEHTSC